MSGEEIILGILADIVYSYSKDALVAFFKSIKSKLDQTGKALSSANVAALDDFRNQIIQKNGEKQLVDSKELTHILSVSLEKADIRTDDAAKIVSIFSQSLSEYFFSAEGGEGKLVSLYSRKGSGYRSLDDCNKLLFVQSQGKVNLSFFDITQGSEYRNEKNVEDILSYLKNENSVQVRGQSLEETAFITGALLSAKLGVDPSHIFLFTSKNSWDSFENLDFSDSVLLSLIPDTNVIPNKKCVFISSLESAEGPNCVTLLPRLENDIIEAIKRTRKGDIEAMESDVRSTHGVWPGLKRKWFPGNYRNDCWPALNDELVIPLLFCQEWEQNDEKPIAAAFELSSATLHRKEIMLSKKDDPFIRLQTSFSRDNFYLVSNFNDFLPVYYQSITCKDIENFIDFFNAIFIDQNVKVSKRLREGICRTLVALYLGPKDGWRSEAELFEKSAQAFLDRRFACEDLFEYAKETRIIVEMVPGYFLSSLLQKNKTLPPFIERAIKNNSWNYGYELVWIVEVILFFPNYRADALCSLSKIYQCIQLPQNSSNPVLEALRHVFVPWCRNLNASTEEIEQLAEQFMVIDENLGWIVLHEQSDILVQASLFGGLQRPTDPRLLNNSPDFLPVSREDFIRLVRSYYCLCVQHSNGDFSKWCLLLDDSIFAYFDESVFAIAQQQLESDLSSFEKEEVILLRDRLVGCISRNKRFSDADWAMSGVQLEKCRKLLGFFEKHIDEEYSYSYLFTMSSYGELVSLNPASAKDYVYQDDDYLGEFQKIFSQELFDVKFVSHMISCCLSLCIKTDDLRKKTNGFSEQPYHILGCFAGACCSSFKEELAKALMLGVNTSEQAEGILAYGRILSSADANIAKKLFSLAKENGVASDEMIAAICSLERFDPTEDKNIFTQLSENQEKLVYSRPIYLLPKKDDKTARTLLLDKYKKYNNTSCALELVLDDEVNFTCSECCELIDEAFRLNKLGALDVSRIFHRLLPKTPQTLFALSTLEIERLASLTLMGDSELAQNILGAFIWMRPKEFGEALFMHYKQDTGEPRNQYESFLSKKLSVSLLFSPRFKGPFIFANETKEIDRWLSSFSPTFSENFGYSADQILAYLLAVSSDTPYSFSQTIMSFLDGKATDEAFLLYFATGIERRFTMHTVDSGHSLQNMADAFSSAEKKDKLVHPSISKAFTVVAKYFSDGAERERLEDEF